jgi:hypothetical protein
MAKAVLPKDTLKRQKSGLLSVVLIFDLYRCIPVLAC